MGRSCEVSAGPPCSTRTTENACGAMSRRDPFCALAGVTLDAPGAARPARAATTNQAECSHAARAMATGSRDYPPRDLCFFPEDAKTAGAHTRRTSSLRSTDRLGGYRLFDLPSGSLKPRLQRTSSAASTATEASTSSFNQTLIQGEASFDATTNLCAVACHDAGGNRPRPTWTDVAPVGCNDCHKSPPAGHFAGPCTQCHQEANATGTALSGGALHLDGRAELGNGNGTCGACHGTGSDPWPNTFAHAGHENPTITTPVACSDCHPVPETVLSPGHLDGVVNIEFSGRATERGAQPVWNGFSCLNTACHGANLTDPPAVVPVWTDPSGAAAACGACHGIPPTQAHHRTRL
jgi:hypothetical protein